MYGPLKRGGGGGKIQHAFFPVLLSGPLRMQLNRNEGVCVFYISMGHEDLH